MKLGNSEDGRELIRGSFEDCYRMIDFLEDMPPDYGKPTSGLTMKQKALPYQVELEGPLRTLILRNGKQCLEIK